MQTACGFSQRPGSNEPADEPYKPKGRHGYGRYLCRVSHATLIVRSGSRSRLALRLRLILLRVRDVTSADANRRLVFGTGPSPISMGARDDRTLLMGEQPVQGVILLDESHLVAPPSQQRVTAKPNASNVPGFFAS